MESTGHGDALLVVSAVGIYVFVYDGGGRGCSGGRGLEGVGEVDG